MGDTLPEIGRDGVEDVCDHCLRGFRRLRSGGAICPSCGCPNDRESAMLAPARENAVMPKPRKRRPRAKKETR